MYCTERTLHLRWCQTSETFDHLTPGLPPVHKRQFNPVVIINTCSELNPAACECSSSSSDQFQKSTADSDEGECSCCCCVDCVADGDSEKLSHGDYIDHVSSRLYDIGRASTGKASARRRLEDERSEHDGG